MLLLKMKLVHFTFKEDELDKAIMMAIKFIMKFLQIGAMHPWYVLVIWYMPSGIPYQKRCTCSEMLGHGNR